MRPPSSLRHRRLSTSLSLESGTALAAAANAATTASNTTMTGSVSASAASPLTDALMQEDAGADVEAAPPARGL